MRRKTNKRKNTLKRYIGGQPKDSIEQPTAEDLAKHAHKTNVSIMTDDDKESKKRKIKDILESTQPLYVRGAYEYMFGGEAPTKEQAISVIMRLVDEVDLNQARMLTAPPYLPKDVDRPNIDYKYAPTIELIHRYISYHIYLQSNNWDHEGGQKPVWA